MYRAADLATLSSTETLAILAVVAASAYLYYGYPRVPVWVLGVPFSRVREAPTAAGHAAGPEGVTCRRCGTENATAYVYCRDCADRLPDGSE